MAVKVMTDQEIIKEATEVLIERLGPGKMARFWAAWRVGAGDYMAIRDQLFAGESVQTLYEKVQAYQQGEE